MYKSPSAFAFAASALMVLVSASPVQKQPRDTSFGPVTWKNPAGGGNIIIFFSDHTLNYGSVSPADIINANVSQTCYDAGTCEDGVIDMGQQDVLSPTAGGALVMGSQDISYSAQGQYPVWIHNAFINTLTAVLRNQTQANLTTYFDDDRCNDQIDCVPERLQTNQYTAPASIGVIQTNTGNEVPGSMQVDFTITQDANSGFCQDLETVGSAISGMFPDGGPIAGGLFTIAGIGCMAG